MARRILIVEGEKDADRAWALDCPATTNAGGAGQWTAHAEGYVGQLIWAGARELVLIPDRDPPGWAHMRGVLASVQEYAPGLIACRWLTLPGVSAKGDLSDWLDQGHTREELEALIQAAPVVSEAPPEPEPETTPAAAATGPPVRRDSKAPAEPAECRVAEGAFCWVRRLRGREFTEELCNFSARIVEEHQVEDGSGERHLVEVIEGRLADGTPLPPLRVPAARFANMSWVAEGWGGAARLKPSFGARDRVRYAIQLHSPAIARYSVFSHTGWRTVAGQWVYLTSAGALGAPEPVRVELEPGLRTYAVPLVAEDPAEAMGRSLALWELGPLSITVPLWAAMFRAPLCEVLPATFTVWLEGLPATLKTSTALLFLSHFGDFSGREDLAAEWRDTANALERKRFVIKDAPLLIDDFVNEGEEAGAKARTLVRGQANRAARARLTVDLAFRTSYPPRGLLLVTGETRPAGQGWASRMLILPFARETIDRARATASQRGAGRLPHAMSGYLGWLAPQLGDPTWRGALGRAFDEARSRARTEHGLLRVPEIVAHLWLGAVTGLRYAAACGALTAAQRDEREALVWGALLGAKGSQDAELALQGEPRRFLAALWGLLTTGQAVLLRRDDPGRDYKGRAPAIGWEDGTSVLLHREAACAAVARVCRDLGEPLRAGPHQVTKFLRDEGVLLKGEGANLMRQVRVAGEPRRVLCLPKAALAAYTGEQGWLGTGAPPEWVEDGEPAEAPPSGSEEEPF